MNKNNLLVISNSFPTENDSYISNIFVKEQLKFIKNYFDNVFVISPVAYGMEFLRKTKQFDYQFDNVKVFFPKYFNIPLFWYYGKSLWINLETRALISLIERENLKFNLIHAHFTWPSGAVAIALKEKFSIPVIITEHTSYTFNKAIEKQDKFFFNTWNKANKIIRVNQGDISLFTRMNIPLQKIISIPNGYDNKKFHPMHTQRCKEVLNICREKKILLNVGNLYGEIKGHKYLIDAIYHIIKTRKDILCVIIGGGKLRNTLQRQIHSLKLNNYIFLLGPKPHQEIPLWMNAADLFVLPSLNEGNPTVMFEALGCGLPFVGTRVGGVPEIITSEDYGLLVEPGNAEDLAEKIMIALDKEWDREKIMKYAEQFTWERIAKLIYTVYKSV